MAKFIGIAGTHSTGKTTFVQRIAEKARQRGISVEIVSDTATKARDAGFPILRDHTFESTLWIVTSVIKAELEAERKAQLVLVDRPVPDALGYLEAALAATKRGITTPEREYLEVLTHHHTTRYSILLKTQLNESIPLGPDRDSDLEFRKDADRQIDRVLARLGIDVLDPESAEAGRRVETILTSIARS